MSYYDALIAKWGDIAGTVDEKLAALNSEIVAGPKVDVDVSRVTGYLARNLKLASLIAYADNPPQGADGNAVLAAQNLVALFRLPQPPAFWTSNPDVYSLSQMMLGVLASDPLSGITLKNVSDIMALTDTQTLWWQANVYPEPINYTNLSQAGLI